MRWGKKAFSDRLLVQCIVDDNTNQALRYYLGCLPAQPGEELGKDRFGLFPAYTNQLPGWKFLAYGLGFNPVDLTDIA